MIGRLPGDIDHGLVVEVINDVLDDDVLVLDDNELLDVVCPYSHERARVDSKAKQVDSFVIICASKAGRLAIRVILRIHECCVSSSSYCSMPYFIA